MEQALAIPDLPDAPADALPVLTGVMEGLVDGLDGAWTIEPEARPGHVSVHASRRHDGRRFGIHLAADWDDEDLPTHWTLAADVAAEPVVTRADQIIGFAVVAVCVALGAAAGGAAFWYVPWVGLLLATPVALVVTIGSLVVALFVTPKSPPPPVPPDVEARFLETVRTNLERAVAEGGVVLG